MKVVESTIRGVSVLAPMTARLDAGSCTEFHDRLREILARGQRLVVCDLSAVTFMDSTGLSVLLGAIKELSGDGALACAGMSPAVRRLFQVTRLDSGLVKIHDSVEKAVESLAALRMGDS
jgi:anti-sigma B factor antagonist